MQKFNLEQLIGRLQKKEIMASVLVGALALGLILFLFAFRGAIFIPPESDNGGPFIFDQMEKYKHRHPLTGLSIKDELKSLQVYAVTIDNHFDARPQNGLDYAFLVFEMPVESNITRFLAFYSEDQKVDKIGPVRSARPYYLDYVSEFDALYSHVGGSPQALDVIGTTGIFDLDQFFNGNYFWRDNNRFAPHNVFTSTELLNKAVNNAKKENKAPDLLYGRWQFADVGTLQATSGGDVSSFSIPEYGAKWVYSAEINQYHREDLNIFASNIAVIITDIEIIDEKGRKQIKTIGEGDAVIFQNNQMIEGKWKKTSTSARLRFFDQDDNEITWTPGATWIEVVGDRGLLSL